MPVDILTLDVNVIMIGNKMSDRECEQHHIKLLRAFESQLFLAMDNGGQIRQLYENRVGASSAGRHWLRKLATNNRIRLFPLGRFPKALKVKLDDTGFDWDDQKYVRLAMETPDKHWVTEDSAITEKHRKLFREHVGVVTHDTKSACALVGS